jgi:putative Ca2+/H+ antiporter (TMEM165/GDT1 family)
LVFISEMGDKTQLLSLVLASRFKKPWTIMLGVFIATVLNHALASGLGSWVASQLSPKVLAWILANFFFIFAGWVLIPDKEGELKESSRFGALITTIIAFFLAEMGDKTQLATVALGAKYSNTAIVTLGTTLGMLASNALAIFAGEKLLARIPMKWVRIFACVLFVGFGVAILVGYYRGSLL